MIKHTDPVPDPRAVNQDKKNMLFSVSVFFLSLIALFSTSHLLCESDNVLCDHPALLH